jgi:hypothetical protein
MWLSSSDLHIRLGIMEGNEMCCVVSPVACVLWPLVFNLWSLCMFLKVKSAQVKI